MKEKVLVVCYGWGQGKKKNDSRFPATDIGIRLRRLYLRSSWQGVNLLLAYFWPERSSPWVSSGCLLASGTKQQMGQGSLEGGALLGSMEQRGQGRLHYECSASELVMRLKDYVWG